MSRDPHPPPLTPSTTTQLPPLAFKHCRSSSTYSHSSHSVPGHPKAYYRFHGGIGDGCRATKDTSVVCRRRPPVSQAKIPAAGGFVQKTASATGGTGTGVFIPVYCTTRIITMHDDNNLNNTIGGMEEGENQQKNYEEEIPVEMLLPSEWTY